VTTILVRLPAHLRTLAKVTGDVRLEVAEPVTLAAVLDALEAAHPVLLGTVRDRTTRRRRSFVRFFADQQDLSHADPADPLPPSVVAGREPLQVVGALAGG
jgi:hypothetical protein